MKFRFKLEALLTLKKRDEEKESIKLSFLFKKKYEIEDKITFIHSEITRHKALDNGTKNQEFCSVLSLNQLELYKKNLKSKEKTLFNEKNKIEKEIEKQRLKIQEKNKEVKILEKLKEIKLKDFLDWKSSIEKKEESEIYNRLFMRKKNETPL